MRLYCLARNGRTGVPALLLRGVVRSGEESRSVRHCGSGDRGAATLRPDQAMRGEVLARAEQRPGKKAWRILAGPHKRFGFRGEGIETLACNRADGRSPGRTFGQRPPSAASLGPPILTADRRSARGQRSFRSRSTVSARDDSGPVQRRGGEVHPLLIARPAGIRAGPGVSPCPDKGSAKTVIRTQAVTPATTAPMTANTSRQASEGTPIWATPSVA